MPELYSNIINNITNNTFICVIVYVSYSKRVQYRFVSIDRNGTFD